MTIIFLLLLNVQRSSGCYANRAQSTVSMAWFLALSSMLLLLSSYFAGLQVARFLLVMSCEGLCDGSRIRDWPHLAVWPFVLVEVLQKTFKVGAE